MKTHRSSLSKKSALVCCIWLVCLVLYIHKSRHHHHENFTVQSNEIFANPEDRINGDDGIVLQQQQQQQQVWIETNNFNKFHVRIKNIMKNRKQSYDKVVEVVSILNNNDNTLNRHHDTRNDELGYFTQYQKLKMEEVRSKHHEKEVRNDEERSFNNNNKNNDTNNNGCNGTNSRVLSYSMFGEKGASLSRFLPHILKEASQIPIYKTFTIRIYTDSNNVDILKLRFAKNRNIEFCDVRKIPDMHRTSGMLWRFLPMTDLSCEVMCSRDLDSPLLNREGDAVDEWLKADGKIIHVMRDKQYHNVPILGGMWCFRPSINRPLSQHIFNRMITRAKHPAARHERALDQKLLQEELWPLVRFSSVQHDSYYCDFFTGSVPFPSKRRDFHVGCVRDCSVDDVKECPVACRPKEHLDWKYC